MSYLIYNHIGTIYRFRNLENYTLDFYEKANKVALLSQDSYYINDSYINLARVNAMQKKYENAIKFYIMVIELAKENNDQKDNYKENHQHNKKAFRHSGQGNTGAAGRIYRGIWLQQG